MSDVPTIICALVNHPRFTPDFDDYIVDVISDYRDKLVIAPHIWYVNAALGYVLYWEQNSAGEHRRDADGYPIARKLRGHIVISRLTQRTA